MSLTVASQFLFSFPVVSLVVDSGLATINAIMVVLVLVAVMQSGEK